MVEEMESLIKNKAWTLVDRPRNQIIVSCEWIFKTKEGILGVEKVRLVARGFTQREGVDYNEIFLLVVKHSSIRMILALVADRNMELEQLDVKVTFLHGELEETVYMQQPEGFVKDKNKVCLLRKSLYGLKQSPRQWYERFDEYMLHIGFTRSKFDSCVYIRFENDQVLAYLLLYVDDMLIASKNIYEIET